jgi:hypothetical protein
MAELLLYFQRNVKFKMSPSLIHLIIVKYLICLERKMQINEGWKLGICALVFRWQKETVVKFSKV